MYIMNLYIDYKLTLKLKNLNLYLEIYYKFKYLPGKFNFEININ